MTALGYEQDCGGLRVDGFGLLEAARGMGH